MVGDKLAELPLAVGPVSENGRVLEVDLADQFLGDSNVRGIASGQHDCYGIAQGVHSGVNLGAVFKFSQTARKVMYTTNAIESLNSGFRRLNRGRTIFPNAMGLTKALYLATWELTKKWTMPVRNWGQVYAELDIMFPGRLTRN